jgi:hypothetical protein
LPLPEFLPGGADVAVAFVVIGELVAREGAVGMLGFVEHWDVRLDPVLIREAQLRPQEKIPARAPAPADRFPLWHRVRNDRLIVWCNPSNLSSQ